jgi:hypothetical protein
VHAYIRTLSNTHANIAHPSSVKAIIFVCEYIHTHTRTAIQPHNTKKTFYKHTFGITKRPLARCLVRLGEASGEPSGDDMVMLAAEPDRPPALDVARAGLAILRACASVAAAGVDDAEKPMVTIDLLTASSSSFCDMSAAEPMCMSV